MSQSSQLKRELRGQILHRLRGLSAATKARWDQNLRQSLADYLVQHPAYRLHLYLPFTHEIDLYPLWQQLLEQNLTLICPQTLPQGQLKHWVLKDLKRLASGPFQTLYPEPEEAFEGVPDLVVVPGLAFDDAGARLGYGGGYYDRLLKRWPQVRRVALAYPFQRLAQLPSAPHDVPINEVLVAR